MNKNLKKLALLASCAIMSLTTPTFANENIDIQTNIEIQHINISPINDTGLDNIAAPFVVNSENNDTQQAKSSTYVEYVGNKLNSSQGIVHAYVDMYCPGPYSYRPMLRDPYGNLSIVYGERNFSNGYKHEYVFNIGGFTVKGVYWFYIDFYPFHSDEGERFYLVKIEVS